MFDDTRMSWLSCRQLENSFFDTSCNPSPSTCRARAVPTTELHSLKTYPTCFLQTGSPRASARIATPCVVYIPVQINDYGRPSSYVLSILLVMIMPTTPLLSSTSFNSLAAALTILNSAPLLNHSQHSRAHYHRFTTYPGDTNVHHKKTGATAVPEGPTFPPPRPDGALNRSNRR